MPSGELRRLSAADTGFNKLLATLVASAFVLLPLFVANEMPPVKRLASAFCGLVMFFPVLSVLVWGQFRMKVVETDGRSLFVSSLLKTVRVPLAFVDSVVQNRMRSRARVIVSFRQLTPFGSEIVFSARGNWVPFTSGRDVAEDLRMLVAQAKAEEQAGSVFRSRDSQPASGRA